MRTERIEELGQMLSSWKEIAAYLGRTIRTCQRLETTMGLPIHRLDGSPKAHVFAYRNELDAWMAQKVNEHGQERRKPRRLLFIGIAGAAVITAAVLVFLVFRPGPGANSIAVLPFDDLSPQPGSEHVPAGITEDLTNALARIRGFQVPGLMSAVAVKVRKLDARNAGRALNVRYLLEGSAQVTGRRIRVRTRLIKARNGYQLWTESYDRPMDEYFVVTDNITRSVVARLGIVLSAREESALSKRPTADMQAYELYMTGRYLLGRPWPETPKQALQFFDLALGRDPKFALAYVGIAQAYMNMISQYQAKPNDAGPKAEAAAEKALALAPDLPEAIALDAWVRFLYLFEWDAGEKGLARALELKPDDSMIRGWHAMALLTQRRYAEARGEIKRALATDPLMPVLYAYSMWIHLFTGQYDEVLEEFRGIQTLQPNFEFVYFGEGMALLKKGRIDEGIEVLRKGCDLPHSNGRPEAGLATAYVMKGDREAAEAVYARLLKEREASGQVGSAYLAWIRAALGDIDGAYEWMETAVLERDPNLPFIHVYTESVLPEVARQPRFQAILDRLRLPH